MLKVRLNVKFIKTPPKAIPQYPFKVKNISGMALQYPEPKEILNGKRVFSTRTLLGVIKCGREFETISFRPEKRDFLFLEALWLRSLPTNIARGHLCCAD